MGRLSGVEPSRSPEAEASTTGRTSGWFVIATEVDRTEAQQGANAIGHGKFQRFILWFTITAHMVLLCHSNVLALITDPVDHWCKPPQEFAGLPEAQWKNVGIPADEAGGYDQCRVYVRPGSARNDSETLACDAWDYNGEQATASARSFWDLVCFRTWLLSLGNGVFMSGAMCVVPFMGYLADTKGRQPVILGASYLLLVCALVFCFAEVYPFYLTLRFVNSACASTVHIVTVILLFEVVPLQYRALYLALGSSVGVLLVELFFAIVAAFRTTWFLRQLMVISPTILLLSATFVVYESPLWLLAMSRLKEAEELMFTVADLNGVSRSHAEQAIERIKSEIGKVVVPRSPASPVSLLHQGSLRIRAAAVFATTFTIMLSYYSLTWSGKLASGLNPLVRTASVLALAPTYLATYVALNILGRLQLMLLLFTLMGAATALYSLASYAEPQQVAYTLVIAAKCFASALIPTNYLYMAELFPTSVRSAVICAAYTFGRVGAVLASVLSLSQNFGREDAQFAVIAALGFVSVVWLTTMPETTSRGSTIAAARDGKGRDLLDIMLHPMRRKNRKIIPEPTAGLNQ